MDMSLSLRLGPSSPALDSATAALIARMTTPPTAARAALINAAIVALKSAGVWAKLEVLYFFAAADSQAALLNWISSSFNASEVLAPTFTVDRGYAGDASTSYLNSNWNTSTSAIFLQNSGSMGSWINAGDDVGSDSRTSIGAGNGFVAPRSSAGTVRGRMNTAATENFGSSATRYGFTAISRTAANLVTAYKAGVPAGTSSTASAARSNFNVFIGALNNSGTPAGLNNNRNAMAFGGSGLSDAEMLALYNAANTYLTAVGGA